MFSLPLYLLAAATGAYHQLPQGAAAVLQYNAIQSPFAQPRNAILGHFFSIVAGTGVSKLFQLSSNFQNLKWVCGAVATGVASAVMTLTGTLHPPGGSVALLAATDDEAIALGWYSVPLTLLGSVLMTATACIVNNIQRQYPQCWWTPADLAPKKKETDEEKASHTPLDSTKGPANAGVITISGQSADTPEGFILSPNEKAMLDSLRIRLKIYASRDEIDIAVPDTPSFSSEETRVGDRRRR